jgi:tetratricopeptide (TPR) repeat protein
MSRLRIIVCLLCLISASSVLAAGEKDYKELYNKGVEHNKKGEFAEAIGLYSKAIALKKDSAALYFVRGRAYLQSKKYDLAVADMDKAVGLKLNYAEAYNIRGMANAALERKDKALADFKKGCALGLKEACANAR